MSSESDKPNVWHESPTFVSQVRGGAVLLLPEFLCGRSNTLMESSQR